MTFAHGGHSSPGDSRAASRKRPHELPPDRPGYDFAPQRFGAGAPVRSFAIFTDERPAAPS
jgi:hypothetical protein